MQTKDLLGTNATVISVSNGLSKEDPQVDRTLDDVVFPVNATHFRLAVEVKVKIATDSQIRNQWQRLAIHVRISAIVDAHNRLIVDGEARSPRRRWGSAQELN